MRAVWLLFWLPVLACACSALVDPDVNDLEPGTDEPGDGMDAGQVEPGDDGGPSLLDGAAGCGSCSDDIACTVDGCQGEQCSHVADDGACGAGERCNPGRGCVPERCVESADCDDANLCNGTETCEPDAPDADARTGCVSPGPLDCDDGVACTVDRCDSAQGCLSAPNDSVCSDGVNCTVDSCDAQQGCVHEASQALCDACFVASFCSATTGCEGGIARSCSDGDTCTLDTCDVDQGMCVHTRDPNGGDACAIPPDTCESAEAIELDAFGVAKVTGSFASVSSTYSTNCGASATRDAVYAIDVNEVSDIVLDTTQSVAGTSLAVAPGTCSAQAFGFACAGSVSSRQAGSRLLLHHYDPSVNGSRLYVLVDALTMAEVGEYTLRVEVTPAASDDCDDAPLDLGIGGTVHGFIADRRPENAWGNLRGNCQSGGGEQDPEALFVVHGASDGSLSLLVSSEAFQPVLYARTVCDSRDGDVQLGCDPGDQPGRADLTIGLDEDEHAFVVVDGGENGARYVLRVTP